MRSVPAAFLVLLAVGAVVSCAGRSTLDLPPGHLTVPTASTVDFGLTACGSASPALAVTVANEEASSPVHWTATLEGPFAFDGASSGILLGHSSDAIHVRATVPLSSIAGTPVDGTLRIENDATSQPALIVPLRVTPQGAMLRVVSLPLDFGDVPVLATTPWVPALITNDGNVQADVSIAPPSDPQFFLGIKSLLLPPGDKREVAIGFAPTMTGVLTASVKVDAKAPLCGGPVSIPVQGKGTKGVVMVSPGSLDFGQVGCGTTAAPKTLTVANQGDAPFTYSAALGKGLDDFYVLPSSGTVAPGGTAELSVLPVKIPATSAVTPELYSDAITLTTSVPDDPPHIIALHQSPLGAILTFPPTIATGRSLVDSVHKIPFPIANNGNITVSVSATSAGNVLSVPPISVTTGGQPVQSYVEVRANPAKLGIDDGVSFSLVANGPICGVTTASVSGVVHAYDTALDLDADGGSYCIVGHTRRVYCSCTDDCFSLGLPADSDTVLIPSVAADQVLVGVHGVCYRNANQLDCGDFGPSSVPKFSITLPSDWTGVWGSTGAVGFHGCVTSASGPLRCFANSAFGQWGDGTPGHYLCYTTLTDAMSGETPISAYAAGWAGFALRNGDVLAAGSWTGSELGNAASNTPTAMVPVTVDGLHDAVSVAAMIGVAGACVVRATGAVACWGDGHIAAAERGGFTDAVTIVPLTFDDGWVLRNTGDLAEWLGTSHIGVPGSFHLPIVKLKGHGIAYNFGPARTFAVEAGGEVTAIAKGLVPHRVKGFEGP